MARVRGMVPPASMDVSGRWSPAPPGWCREPAEGLVQDVGSQAATEGGETPPWRQFGHHGACKDCRSSRVNREAAVSLLPPTANSSLFTGVYDPACLLPWPPGFDVLCTRGTPSSYRSCGLAWRDSARARRDSARKIKAEEGDESSNRSTTAKLSGQDHLPYQEAEHHC